MKGRIIFDKTYTKRTLWKSAAKGFATAVVVFLIMVIIIAAGFNIMLSLPTQ